MSHISQGFAVLTVAAMLSSPAAAQGVVTQKNISLGLAQSIAQAALDKCISMGFKVAVSVVDRGGLVLVTLRGDGAGIYTTEGAERRPIPRARSARAPATSSSGWPSGRRPRSGRGSTRA